MEPSYQLELADDNSLLPVEDRHDLVPLPLPVVDRGLLHLIFSRLLASDKSLLLQHKLLPVATLPHLTLYAAAGREAAKTAAAMGFRIVGLIAPDDFRTAVHRHLSVEILHKVTFDLQQRWPQFSASTRVTKKQFCWVAAILSLAVLLHFILPVGTMPFVASFMCAIFFLAVISMRIFCIVGHRDIRSVKARPLHDSELPTYTVLVPVYRETQVLQQLLRALTKLNYPQEKLDIKLILEENDSAMQRAVSCLDLPAQFDVIVVPAGKPQTKPRALNYALQFARGQLVTIFDAEDVPEPQQLRKAAAQFAISGSEVACLQAELTFFNPNENWLTRQFTIEYAVLFKLLLPSLAKEGLPIMLGGTSNHFRITTLRAIGGWDPFNVTEDADLGLRLARNGYEVAILPSGTFEEATSQTGNWLLQRTRWLKGFLQTWLVHMRSPSRLIREVGWAGFWIMQASTIGVFMSALLYPFLLGWSVYLILSGAMGQDSSTWPKLILGGLNILVLLAGHGVSIYAGYLALRKKRIAGWWRVLASMPCYWLFMCVAAWMALWQFIVKPFHWNKTRHGVSEFQKRHES